ncbi:hypothetical protein ABB37_04901 [Leptomonas pyrrhocoris]|uniref:Uncharacterized protein n=1 Tax=Leptomonas pyrrhocoris TaxID=157538 RepID=A0A0N0DV99_LEPPY|nr:hypothetical protein ABB37_04901 [Leptomonas pyrrhocoris]KPA79804.1 hypothetical protein ABB37_04901 [Leptomonas pyrrhocoris]|eukprot:XP_015658243.1 hypothetical protein ABB37_04901 [Leptomonas pyrrhocoris]
MDHYSPVHVARVPARSVKGPALMPCRGPCCVRRGQALESTTTTSGTDIAATVAALVVPCLSFALVLCSPPLSWWRPPVSQETPGKSQLPFIPLLRPCSSPLLVAVRALRKRWAHHVRAGAVCGRLSARRCSTPPFSRKPPLLLQLLLLGGQLPHVLWPLATVEWCRSGRQRRVRHPKSPPHTTTATPSASSTAPVQSPRRRGSWAR